MNKLSSFFVFLFWLVDLLPFCFGDEKAISNSDENLAEKSQDDSLVLTRYCGRKFSNRRLKETIKLSVSSVKRVNNCDLVKSSDSPAGLQAN